MSQVLILLGSNRGDRVSFLKTATELIERKAGHVIKRSSIYETAPWGFHSNDDFLNQVLLIETEMDPENLLKRLLKIEISLGRMRNSDKYESRNIDIDILFYDQLRYASKDLLIPHPRILERKFTLVPLIEVAANFIHPEYNITIEKLADRCNDNLNVALFEPVDVVQ
jgi:2-amino-4-hydroxy-6-hydroxymethyldihydropteridine diphosphokinase